MGSILGRSGSAALYLTLLLILGACGQNSWVKDVRMSVATEDGMVYADTDVYLNTQGTTLMPIHLPILLPGRDVAIGDLIVQAYAGSELEANYLMTVLLNLTEIAQLPKGVTPILPNGDPIPVAGIDEGAIVALPIGGNGSRLYFSLDINARRMMLGTAVVINNLENPVGQPFHIFPEAILSPEVRAWGGMFFGDRPRTNGFGVFIDAQQVLKDSDREMQLLAAQSSIFRTQSLKQKRKANIDEDWDVVSDTLSQKEQAKLNRYLYRLQTTKTQLRLQ